MIQEIDKTISVLQNEIQTISHLLVSEKEDKVKTKLLKQINTINNVLSKLVEIKTNSKFYAK